MTIPNVLSGEFIEPSWGNAVADQLNVLPASIQSGTATGTTDSIAVLSVSFPVAFGGTPLVVAVRQDSSGGERTLHVQATVTTTGFSVRCFNGGTQAQTTSVTVAWIAIGPPA